MHVASAYEMTNILAALMRALERPHTIMERGGELFIVPNPKKEPRAYEREVPCLLTCPHLPCA
jgi:hypothetical protein